VLLKFDLLRARCVRTNGPACTAISASCYTPAIPFKQPVDFVTERVWLGQIRDKIMSLLEHHIVTLVDRDYMLIGLMKTDQGTVQVVMLARDGPTTARMVL
jgi:hypothetical protein